MGRSPAASHFAIAALVFAGALAGTGTATVALAAAPAASAPAAQPRAIKEANALYEFTYAYPAQAAAIPALKAWLEADIATSRRNLISSAREGRTMAKEEGFDFNPYSHTMEWKVVTNLPGWLSLSGFGWQFTGGAHGNSWSATVLWDKQAGVRRAPLDLFISKAAFANAIRGPFCRALNKERAERRGEPVDPASGSDFDACVDPAEATVMLGSADKLHFTRMGIELDPYVAGPYVEGSYTINLPITAAVVQAVKPQYRAAFAVQR